MQESSSDERAITSSDDHEWFPETWYKSFQDFLKVHHYQHWVFGILVLIGLTVVTAQMFPPKWWPTFAHCWELKRRLATQDTEQQAIGGLPTQISAVVQLLLPRLSAPENLRELDEPFYFMMQKDLLEKISDDFRHVLIVICLLYTSPSPRDRTRSRMPSSA